MRSYVANTTMLYGTYPVHERAAAAAADGYPSVECWWPFDSSVPSDTDVDLFVESVDNSGAQLIALNFTLGDLTAGERGIASHPQRINEFREHCEVLTGIVARLGVRVCHVPYGRRLAGDTAVQDDTAVQNLVLASARLGELGAVPAVEPTSGLPDYPVTSAAEAVAIIERVDAATGRRGSVGLLADLYHLAANGEDIDAVLRAHIDRIVHVQVADFPGRHEPGTGALDIDGSLALLGGLGYRGEVALEYIPSR